MVKLVLFDIDGTLVRTNGAGMKAFEHAFEAEFGLRNAIAGVSFAGRTDVSLVREILHRHGFRPEARDFQRFFERYVFLVDHLLPACGGAVCPGVEDWLVRLRGLASPPVVGLLTGNIRLGAEIKLRHFGLWEHFTLGGFADDHEERSQIAMAAKARGERFLGASLKGAEIVVVGDTGHDVRCGRAIGAQVLAVTTGGETRAQLQAHCPDWLVDDLRELDAAEVCAGASAHRE